MTKRLKIAIATGGRFHVLDLARELAALGHEVKFYSYVPKSRAIRFGLPTACHVSLLPFALPLLVLLRICPRAWSNYLNLWLFRFMDMALRLRMKRCDVLIAMSGFFTKSLVYAKSEYGAKMYIERGSRHIESQKQILDDLRSEGRYVDSVNPYVIARELYAYDVATKIVIPSIQVKSSFKERGVSESRLFRNPYGADLEMFQPTSKPENSPPKILNVGMWSYQKGSELLVQAWQMLNVPSRLVHVGPVYDAPLPESKNFEHFDPVPQWQLADYYSDADCFVLASRQEGLALVQCQALACGVPLVCTDRTGGEDLKELLTDDQWITVVPHDDAQALADAISAMLMRIKNDTGSRDLLGENRSALSWAAYGKRYEEELLQCIGT